MQLSNQYVSGLTGCRFSTTSPRTTHRVWHAVSQAHPSVSRLPPTPLLTSPRQGACQCSATTTARAKVGPVLSPDVVKELDTYLNEADGEEKALKLVAELKKQGKIRGFAGAHQVPKRQYTIEELRLNNIDATKLLSPEDKSLNSVRNAGQAAALAGLLAFSASVGFEGAGQVLGLMFATVFLFGLDQVGNGGGGEALLVDTLGRLTVRTYARRVALHEAGHFLVAYLLGLLPRAYTLSAWEAFTRYRALNVQAGTQFCDASFQQQVANGRLSASSLESYTCVALSGVVTEALCYGQAEGGVGDVYQLDGMLRALGFTQKKADGEVRWAVLNVAAILRRHAHLHAMLADAMQQGKSVASCIALIEEQLSLCDPKEV